MEQGYWEAVWRCRKHPSPPRSGVCPACLRDRLLLICPECAGDRPCSCCASSSSSSSSSSASSSFHEIAAARYGGGGPIGRMADLIESEPAFRRSRSAAVPFVRRTSDEAAAVGRAKGWAAAMWPFSKAAGREVGGRSAAEAAADLSRSRSVGVARYLDRRSGGGGGGGRDGKEKGWKWYFPSPMKAFRQRKSAANEVTVGPGLMGR